MVPYPKSITYNLEAELSRGRSLLRCVCTKFNPVMQIGISFSYLLDQSISILRIVGWYVFYFYSNLYRLFCKQIVEILIRRHVLWRLIWVCTVCLCPTNRMQGLYG